MMQTNHVLEKVVNEGKLETAIGICPACSNLSEFIYLGEKKLPKNGETFKSYGCSVCGSNLNAKYIKWKQ